jgi:uncharacterized protein DUF6174
MRVKTALPAILLLTLTGACAGQPAEVAAPAPAPTWTAPAKYAFTLTSDCGERALIGRFRVTVRDDVARAEGLDDAARRALMLRVADLVPTLSGLEAEAETARRGGADEVTIERDAADGHATKITIDTERNAVDDEACYTIEDYTIGLTGTPAPSPSR